MISRIAQQTLIWSLIVFVVIWGYIPSLWDVEWPSYTMLALALTSLLVWAVVGLANLKNFLTKRSSQFGISLAISALATLAILVAVNYVANLYNQKKDISVNQLYSLSDQSKKIAAQIKDDLEIIVWTTDIQRMVINQDLQKFLENYRIESGGKIKIRVRNPNEDINAKALGITKDNVIVLRSAAGRETRIESVNQEKIEEQVTNSILKLAKNVKKTVCFTTDNGELSLEDPDKAGLSEVKLSLQNASYVTQGIEVASGKEVPASCETVVVAGPKGAPTENSVKLLSEYLEKGGKLLVLLSGESHQQWNQLIKPYGVELRNDVIVDTGTQHPLALTTQRFVRTVDIVKPLRNAIVMFQSSSLATPTAGKQGRFSVTPFVMSEPRTFAKKKTAQGLISTVPAPGDQRGPLTLAVLVEDPTSKPHPKNDEGGIPGFDIHDHGEGDDHDHGHDHDHGRRWNPLNKLVSEAHAQVPAPMTSKATPPDAALATAPNAKLIVISSELFASNTFVGQGGNLDLFLNSVNYLLEDKDLIGIRPREFKSTTLELSPETDRKVQATVYLLAGLCFLGAMAATSRRRKMSV